MPIHNTEIAAIFDEIADLLEIKGTNPFRVRAYRNATQTLQGLGPEVQTLVDKGEDLTELPGIGKELAAKIHEILQTRTCRALEKLHGEIPSTLTELLKIPGLGPKRVRALYRELGIQTLDQLLRAARDRRIRHLPGFGAKTEHRILEVIETQMTTKQRSSLAVVVPYAEALVAHLMEAPRVEKVVLAGSYRRAKESVGDLDILVTASGDSDIMERFVTYEGLREILSQGKTRATIILRSGLQVDLRLVPQPSFGAALQYFTGSQAHNIAIRRLAQQRHLKINEYGVFKGEEWMGGETEAFVYESVGLAYIPPELREDRGEIEAARAGQLPELIKLEDLKGDLHVHTAATDGRNTLEAMALAAREQGLEYIAITEHSRKLSFVRGLDTRRLLEQCEEVDRLNAKLKGITILKGIEVEILADGRLDLPNDILGRLDIVVGAIHTRFNLPREAQTGRILRAMEHPFFTILAHPTGRRIGERESYDVDMEQIIAKARERGCFLELNANPKRLDLLDTHCRLAKDAGILVSINSDAHRALDFGNLRFGIGQARRGWLEKQDVLNTRSLEQLRRLLKKTR